MRPTRRSRVTPDKPSHLNFHVGPLVSKPGVILRMRRFSFTESASVCRRQIRLRHGTTRAEFVARSVREARASDHRSRDASRGFVVMRAVAVSCWRCSLVKVALC